MRVRWHQTCLPRAFVSVASHLGNLKGCLMLSALLADNGTTLLVRSSLPLAELLRFMYVVAFLWRFTQQSGVPVEHDETRRSWPSNQYHHCTFSLAPGTTFLNRAIFSCQH